jgi:hypothetical protein
VAQFTFESKTYNNISSSSYVGTVSRPELTPGACNTAFNMCQPAPLHLDGPHAEEAHEEVADEIHEALEQHRKVQTERDAHLDVAEQLKFESKVRMPFIILWFQALSSSAFNVG